MSGQRNGMGKLPANPLSGFSHLSIAPNPVTSSAATGGIISTSLPSSASAAATAAQSLRTQMAARPTTAPGMDREETLSPGEICKPQWLNTRNSFRDVTDPFLIMNYGRNAAHVMLYSKAKDTDRKLGKYPLKYRVLMQLRFDGKFGFPGGFIDEIVFDEDEVDDSADFNEFLGTVKQGLRREVREELMLNFDFQPKYVFSAVPKGSDLPSKMVTILHFFTAEVPLATMEMIEANYAKVITSDEVLGLANVPLYNLSEESYANGYTHGLPSFLTNSFAGNSLEQLLRGCLKEELISEDEIQSALRIAGNLIHGKLNTQE